MKQYHKIQTVFKRDPETKFKTLLIGEFSLPEFEFLTDCEWVFTEKVDGTNIRVMFDGGGVGFQGKTDRAQIPPHLGTALEHTFYPLVPQMREMFPDGGVCLYGEGYGPKIQNGGKYRPDPAFVLFDIRVGEWWLKREDVEGIGQALGVDVVPVVGTGTLYEMVDLVASGFESRWGGFIAEGIVARPLVELRARNGERIITKIKHKDFVK